MVYSLFVKLIEYKMGLIKDFFKINCGYVLMEGENFDLVNLLDLKEVFNIGFDFVVDDLRVVNGELFWVVN